MPALFCKMFQDGTVALIRNVLHFSALTLLSLVKTHQRQRAQVLVNQLLVNQWDYAMNPGARVIAKAVKNI